MSPAEQHLQLAGLITSLGGQAQEITASARAMCLELERRENHIRDLQEKALSQREVFLLIELLEGTLSDLSRPSLKGTPLEKKTTRAEIKGLVYKLDRIRGVQK